MRVMTGPVHRYQADCRQPPAQRGGDLDIHPRIPGLGREQIGDVRPVPGGADRAVDQRCSRSHHLGQIGHALGQDLPDQRAACTGSPIR
jgi:hypothetical protein